MAAMFLLILSVVLWGANCLLTNDPELRQFYEKNTAKFTKVDDHVKCALLNNPYTPDYAIKDYRELVGCKDLQPKLFSNDEIEKAVRPLLDVYSPVYLCNALSVLKPHNIWRQKLECN